ncbi:hypothetical protein PIB30_068222 [Stylosanthes scabra]|uniref:DUF4283 domain-containing protein n=2 Tax=Stylosanthes scabra TaxID=79078 RepID=A0ABU6VLD2_9FABA|nr:hypothetical protein [Stylosanthes scabra]
MKESSARVSRQEEDLVQRSTKKVKTRKDVDLNEPNVDMEIGDKNEGNSSNSPKVSYKDSLLTPVGPHLRDEIDGIGTIDENEPNPEEKWYNDEDKGNRQEKPFDPCPTIPVSQKEFEEWCKPWRSTLMVKILDEGDYNHALMERPWMIVGHYVIVQRWIPFFLSPDKEVKKIVA